MFSAIVAAVLIMTSVVLVTTMTTTEDKLGSQLYYMLNTFQLNDAAAIARSDALQSFNYNFRSSMQDYLTFSDTEMDTEPGFSILTTTNYENWDEIINTFQRVILLNEDDDHKFDAVIEFVANRTILQFNEGSYGRYHVSLSSKDQDARQNTVNALNEAIACLSPGEDFLEVVDCDGGACGLGTFYFNIPLDCISDASYEALPKIVVKDLITKGETKLPILPKTRLKIYIPLRFFKAIYIARKNAEAMSSVSGLLSSAQLGFCESGCVPNTSPSGGGGGTWSGHECPGNVSQNEIQKLSTSYAGLSTYNAAQSTVANIGLNAYAKQTICENAINNDVGDTGTSDFYNINSSDYAADYPGYGVNGLESDMSGINKIDSCPFKKILASVESAATKIISGSPSGKLWCGKMQSVEADVAFEERNPLYIVKGQSIRYKIRVTTAIYASPASGSQLCYSGGASGAKKCSDSP